MRFLALLLLAACAPAPVDLVSDATGLSTPRGGLGPYGVGRTTWRVPVRVTESAVAEVHVPLDADGRVAEGPFPVVVFVHGGLVPLERYRWFSEHVTTRGYVALAVSHPSDLAIFAQGTSDEALRALRERASNPEDPLFGAVDPDAPAAIAGHSLGGVVAARSFIAAPDDFATVGIIASFPAPWDDLTERAGDPVLSIVGENDGSADLTRVEEAILAQPDPRLYAIVAGMNHYDWADDVTEDELARDGERGRDVDVARIDAMRVIDTWLDAWMRDQPDAQQDWFEEDFPGILETR